jgi:hypothetical protein
MSLYILDTDTVSLYQHGHPRVCANVKVHAVGEVVITVLTVEEQLSGWYTTCAVPDSLESSPGFTCAWQIPLASTPAYQSCRLSNRQFCAIRA